MSKQRITAVIVMVLCFQLLEAQNFATRQLEYLSGLMNCPLPKTASTFRCPKICSLPLSVEYDGTGNICHLGITVFSESLKSAVGKPVCDFQERLFLEVFLQRDETKARKLLDEYNIQWINGYFSTGTFYRSLEDFLRLVSSDAVEYVLTKDSLTWTSSWRKSGLDFGLQFPATYDLISGMDKKEAEIALSKQLQTFRCSEKTIRPVTVEAKDLQQLSGTMYVLREKNLFTRGMNGNLYFRKSNGAFFMLYDRKFPEESIANLFNQHDDGRAEGLELQIRQAAYGGESLSCKMKLSDFQCFIGYDYEIYTGIEKCTAETAEFSVIYKSKLYNCCHLLYVQTTPQNLFDKTEPLKAVFYTFIPNHNIKNLYEESVKK